MIELTEIITIEITKITECAEEKVDGLESVKAQKEDSLKRFISQMYAPDDVKVCLQYHPFNIDEQKAIREANEAEQKE